MKLTISTDGVRDLIGGGPVTECHQSAIDHVYHYGERVAQTVTLTLDPVQALGLAVDLLYQLVDAGVIAGWNTQFPEAVTKQDVLHVFEDIRTEIEEDEAALLAEFVARPLVLHVFEDIRTEIEEA